MKGAASVDVYRSFLASPSPSSPSFRPDKHAVAYVAGGRLCQALQLLGKLGSASCCDAP